MFATLSKSLYALVLVDALLRCTGRVRTSSAWASVFYVAGIVARATPSDALLSGNAWLTAIAYASVNCWLNGNGPDPPPPKWQGSLAVVLYRPPRPDAWMLVLDAMLSLLITVACELGRVFWLVVVVSANWFLCAAAFVSLHLLAVIAPSNSALSAQVALGGLVGVPRVFTADDCIPPFAGKVVCTLSRRKQPSVPFDDLSSTWLKIMHERNDVRRVPKQPPVPFYTLPSTWLKPLHERSEARRAPRLTTMPFFEPSATWLGNVHARGEVRRASKEYAAPFYDLTYTWFKAAHERGDVPHGPKPVTVSFDRLVSTWFKVMHESDSIFSLPKLATTPFYGLSATWMKGIYSNDMPCAPKVSYGTDDALEFSGPPPVVGRTVAVASNMPSAGAATSSTSLSLVFRSTFDSSALLVVGRAHSGVVTRVRPIRLGTLLYSVHPRVLSQAIESCVPRSLMATDHFACIARKYFAAAGLLYVLPCGLSDADPSSSFAPTVKRSTLDQRRRPSALVPTRGTYASAVVAASLLWALRCGVSLGFSGFVSQSRKPLKVCRVPSTILVNNGRMVFATMVLIDDAITDFKLITCIPLQFKEACIMNDVYLVTYGSVLWPGFTYTTPLVPHSIVVNPCVLAATLQGIVWFWFHAARHTFNRSGGLTGSALVPLDSQSNSTILLILYLRRVFGPHGGRRKRPRHPRKRGGKRVRAWEARKLLRAADAQAQADISPVGEDNGADDENDAPGSSACRGLGASSSDNMRAPATEASMTEPTHGLTKGETDARPTHPHGEETDTASTEQQPGSTDSNSDASDESVAELEDHCDEILIDLYDEAEDEEESYGLRPSVSACAILVASTAHAPL